MDPDANKVEQLEHRVEQLEVLVRELSSFRDDFSKLGRIKKKMTFDAEVRFNAEVKDKNGTVIHN